LNTATGLKLPVTVVFTHPTPTALTTHLTELLGLQQGFNSPLPETESAPYANKNIIVENFFRGYDHGKKETSIALLEAAALLRDSFDEHQADLSRVKVDQDGLENNNALHLTFIHSMFSPVGSLQYDELMRDLSSSFPISAIELPGYQENEKIPENLNALMRALALALRQNSDQAPGILVGHSAGAWIVHELARTLEEEGTPASGLILIDSPLPDGDLKKAMSLALRNLPAWRRVTDSTLTATAAYYRLFSNWRPSPIATPTLVIKATEGIGIMFDRMPQASLVQVEADHFSIVALPAVSEAIMSFCSPLQ
ncbi:alpha/beta fold hydrolase, partial [Streptomyces sp. NPDC055109]